MQLSPEQQRAADDVARWLKARDKPFYILQGLAGTGKSTVASTLAAQHDGPSYFMTFTGRAADVLRKKGTPCQTIHSYIYLPTGERREEAAALEAELASCTDARKERKLTNRLEELRSPEFVKRPTSPFDPRGLIVCDEMSMVGKREAEDLLSYGLPILVLGDSGQLPPIEGRGYFNRKPDFELQEIHRQAKESPIIRLAALARAGRPLPLGQHGTSSVINKKDITPEIALGVEQFAVGRNATRENFNAELRTLRGFSGEFPQAGERLMCLRNNRLTGMFNGQVMELAADTDSTGRYLQMSFIDGPQTLVVHSECFTAPQTLRSWSYDRRKKADEFDYSYAATIHKLQGGQFESVLVYPDLFNWSSARADYARLLYTGVTRAIDRVVVAL